MPESPEDLFERASSALRMPPVETWETFPFDGDLRPRTLLPPLEFESPRHGEGGIDCGRCAAPDDGFIWFNEHWRLSALKKPSGLPVIVILEPREHLTDPGDLSESKAAEMGVMLARVELAVRSVGEVGRVHVCRWGDGSEHMHWWFLARPARLPQLRGSFAAIWDDILPPTPQHIWDDNLARVVAALTSAGLS